MTNLLPFTQHDQICDSSLPHGVVEHTTSWLSINPIIGCSLECAYCFRHKWGAPDKPIVNSNVAESVDRLISHPEFKANITPITVNISSTDAMLPTVKATTFECMSRLDGAGYSNVFGITTKCGISEKDISFLTSLQNLRVVVLVTYSAMPRKVEPYPARPRINGLRLLAEAGLPRILYYRPIVPGWNTDSASIRKVLSIGRDYAQAMSMGGLRISPEIRANIERKGLQIPNGHDEFHEKLLPSVIQRRINGIYENLGSNVPLYKHTSCAVSYAFDLPNYNNLFEKPLKNCTRTCPVAQQRRCGTDLQRELALGD